MALKATVYKAALTVSDIDRGYYADHELTLARHPSETEARLMLRLLAFGLPDERRLRRAAGRARRVTLIAYGERAFDVWWRKHAMALERIERLTLRAVTDAELAALESLAARNMALQAIIQDGQVVLSDASASVTVEPEVLLPRP
jgi:uncharacterized protein YaeQ